MNKRDQILQLLATFAAQRPGLEFGNYGDVSAYRSEMRSITADLHTFRRLLAAVSWRSSIGEAQLREAFRAYSGRLTLTDRPDGTMALDYCTGQYFPTEYRKAACAVLASALWDYARANLPKGELMHNSETGETLERYKGLRAGDYLRSQFRREFGRSIASRYFD